MIDIDQIQQKFPFLSLLRHNNQEYVGIIQNSSDKIISFYDYNSILTTEERILFLENGECWWQESNRLLPINLFLQGGMKDFRYCIKTLVNKDIEVVFRSSHKS